MRPLATSANITSDCASAVPCVAYSTLRLIMRSTSTPATGASTRNEICSAKAASPSRKAEPDSR